MTKQWMQGLVVCALGAAVMLAGCKKDAAATPSAPAATAANPDAASAEAFVRHVYDPTNKQGGERTDPNLYTSFIVEQEKAYQQREVEYDGEGTIEADPLCQCQDDDGLSLTSVKAVPTGAGTMDVNVLIKQFANEPGTSPLTLKLVKTSGGWRIDDLVPADPSLGLRALYARDIAEDAKLPKPKHK
jgi:Protein of unknown function (DUF3828)